MRSRIPFAFSSLLLALFPLGTLLAQSSGTISGIVTDQQQAVIEGAEVTLIDTNTNIPTVTATNPAGRYVFLNINSGTYNLTVTKAGFITQRIARQQVEIGKALTLDITLSVGGATTTVEVQAAAGAELQTMNATIGSTVRGDQLILLPNNTRDVSSLITLNVGVTPGGNVAGAVNDQNSFQLDGGNNTSDMDGNQTVYTPSFASSGAPTGVMPTPVESIEEFKLSTSNQTADFNGAAGGQVQLVTRRGTNNLHGVLYNYYFASNIWAANTWKNNHTGKNNFTPLPKTHYNRFGGSLGGPVIKKEILGGRTYLFGMFEGYRFPNTTTFERQTPTPLLRLGVVQLPDATGTYRKYNLNPFPVTYQGETINPAMCGTGACDPRGIGINSLVRQIWNQQMPLPNDPQFGDTYNTQGYLTTLRLPQTSNFLVGRLDHDFGSKNRFYSSYRYFTYSQLTSSQVDIGGGLPGGKFGDATAYAPRPQKPWFLVGALNTTLTSTMTNNFNVSYLRNFWQWSTLGAPPQLPGLGGALSLGPDTATGSLIPYNVNTQSARQRFWNGHDYTFRDDVSWLKGKHLIQFGGEFQRNVDGHQRNDNGQGIMSSFVYQMNDGAGVANTTYVPAGIPAAQLSNYRSFYNQILGIVTQPQIMYTRAGQNLELQPVGQDLFTNVIIPSFNMYFSDTWRMAPTFTLTYGMGYQVEMPPYETEGKQVQLVDQSGKLIDFANYLNDRFTTAQSGRPANPTIGFATIKNVQGGNPKYPYEPFYGGMSPRLAAAWTPKFAGGILGKIFGDGKTVIRGGYSRLYGRLNGVGQVLIPLLGTGLAQAVSCVGPRRDGTCPNVTGGVDPTNAFRIGTDGLVAPLPAVSRTLPQPFFPGVGGNAAAADGTVLDPATRPNHSDQYNFTIQREWKRNVIMEVGYIGRKISNEFQQVNLNAVPWMTTLGGQSFADAFQKTYFALQGGGTPAPQPFFENALGGPNSAFCAGQPSCTAALALGANRTNFTSTQVFTLWGNMERLPGWTLGRTMLNSAPSQTTAVFVNRSNGYGNYNAGFLSLSLRDWHGLTLRSNFTYSRSLGTGAVVQATSSFTALNPWDLKSMYGRQPFDIPLVYNLSGQYSPKFFNQKTGLMGHLLKGWNIAPLFTAQSGVPLRVAVGSQCQSFGQVNCSSGSTYENAPQLTRFTGGNSLNRDVTVASGAGINGNASRGGSGLNMFADPNAVYGQFRRLILGYDTTGGGAGVARGFPLWNLDASIVKEINATERFKAQLMFQFNNVLNHFQPANPAMNIDSPQSWGVVTDNAGVARQVQFGLRISF